MKKISLLLVIALLLTLTSTASFAQKGIELGARAIYQSVWMFNQDDSDRGPSLDYDPTTAMAYGLNVGINFTDNIGIQSGFLISNQGQNYISFDGEPNETTSATRLRYTKIPVMFKFNSDPESTLSFIATAGIQFGFLNNVQYELNGEEVDYIIPIVTEFDSKDAFNNMDLSGAFSIGFRVKLIDNVYAGLSFRADYSLSDIENKDATYSTTLGDFNIYDDERPSTNSLTGGALLEINYVLGKN